MASNTVAHFILQHLLIAILILVPGPLLAEIRLAGSSTILPVAKEAMQIFHEQTGISISIKGGGSDTGVQETLDGSAEIGMVSRALRDGETEELQNHLIGYDGIAVIIHSTIPIESIDKTQIKAIYSGKIRNWRSLGGDDREIRIVTRRQGHASRQLFEKHCSIQQTLPDTQRAGPNAEAIVLVGIDTNAIGYASIGPIEKAMQLGVSIKMLPLDGVTASQENIINGSYPIRRELNLVTKGEPSDEAELFIAFMQNGMGQEIVRKHHLVTLKQQAAGQ